MDVSVNLCTRHSKPRCERVHLQHVCGVMKLHEACDGMQNQACRQKVHFDPYLSQEKEFSFY